MLNRKASIGASVRLLCSMMADQLRHAGMTSQTERVDVASKVGSMVTTLQSIPLPQQLPGPVGCERCLARGF